MNITNIYKESYGGGISGFGYAGTLRNEKRFNIDDAIFLSILNDGTIIRGFIIGIQKSIDENPEYTYTIQIPKEVAEKIGKDYGDLVENIKCDRIFSTIDEAKDSAMKRCELNYQREKKNIESYFSQFEKK